MLELERFGGDLEVAVVGQNSDLVPRWHVSARQAEAGTPVRPSPATAAAATGGR